MFRKKNTSKLLGLKEDATEKNQKPHIKAEKIKINPLKNRSTIAIISLIFAFALAFVAFPIFQSYISKTTEIVVLKSDIKASGKITADMLELKEVGSFGLPLGTIDNISLAALKYAKIDMSEGDYITLNKISDTLQSDDNYLLNLPQGKMALSVNASSHFALSDKLRQGDIVRIFSLDADKNPVAHQELQFVEVLAVTNDLTLDIQNGVKNGEIDEDTYKISTVTLALDQSQAMLVTAMENI